MVGGSALSHVLGLAVVGLAAVGSGGCFHHQAHLPGIFDMRTDGSGLPPPASTAVVEPRHAHPGVEGLVQGAGVSVVGSDVSVEHRFYWLLGAIPIYNQSPSPSLEAALPAGGALTRVEVGETQTPLDVAVGFLVPTVFPAATWILPTWTFVAHAQATSLPAASPKVAGVAPDVRDPRDPQAPEAVP